MKNRRIILLAKRFTLIFLLVVFSTWPLLPAQEVKKYPLYPDVWVREFVDYLDNLLNIYPIGENEVLVYQPSKVDQYGEPVRDAKGNSISVMKTLLFFQGTTIGLKETHELRKKWGVEGLPKERINSCNVGETSEFKPLSDGGAIRWVKKVVKIGERWEERWRTEPGGRHKSRHTTYYNDVSVFERTDANGKTLWQKVYLYFHPWWGSQPEPFVREDAYSFYYFKRGCLSIIDEKRLFLHFSGTRTIYRLDNQGLPKTNDRNLIILDFIEYQKLIKEILDKIDNAKVPSDVYPNPQYGYCMIKSRLKDGSIAYLGDYDYTGEVLAKLFGFDLGSKEVKKVRNAMLQIELQRCAEAYYKMLKE
ncbi:hypothetical protein FJZ33_01220 [Candidatus Poribacteria bacterium]|nr:hypothetical protein [Candidatus Poribacteria bacterium]